MPHPKRHHWVPRFYLEYFAIPEPKGAEPQVHVLHRSRGEDHIVGIHNVAVENHLYAPIDDAGLRDFSTENKLAGLEDLLANIWPRLATDFPDLNSTPLRKGLSLFLATLYLRHPATYAHQRRSQARLRVALDLAPRDERGLPDVKFLTVGKHVVPFDKEEWARHGPLKRTESHQLFADMIRTEAKRLAKKLMKKRWSIVFLEEPLFVTSDNPFFVINPELKPFQFLGPDSMSMFPLSPTRILCVDDLDEPANQYYPVSPDAAGMYNYLTWVNTDGYLISPRHISAVLGELLKVKQQFEDDLGSQVAKG